MVADDTGGIAFYNGNDLEAGFQRVHDDSAHYYLLGYYRVPKDDHRKKNGHAVNWRELTVRINQPNVEVRARKGFYEREHANPDQKWAEDIHAAVTSPVDFTAIPIRADMKLASGSGNEARRVGFMVYVPPTYQGMQPESGRVWLDVAAVVTDSDGKVVDQMVQRLAKDVDETGAAKIRTAGVSCAGVLHLSKGEYTVHFVVRNGLNDSLGSLSAPIKVE